uniref:Uncharacterized protein n=1 Tax=Chloropicon primus TaxID=1764295 RepID=A0A7S2X246_9CHLO
MQRALPVAGGGVQGKGVEGTRRQKATQDDTTRGSIVSCSFERALASRKRLCIEDWRTGNERGRSRASRLSRLSATATATEERERPIHPSISASTRSGSIDLGGGTNLEATE